MNTSANQTLLTHVQRLKAEHPYWGYRRIWAYLRNHEKFPVNRKRIYRLMKQNKLLVPKNRRLKAPRKAVNSKPRTIEPNRYWGIDMTKVMIPAYGWIYLHVVIDWGIKKLLSVHMSLSSKSSDWITALNEAVNLQFPDGIKDAACVRTIKEDLIWTKEYDSTAIFENALKQWVKAYNEDYPHSSLGYMTPYEYERWFNASAA